MKTAERTEKMRMTFVCIELIKPDTSRQTAQHSNFPGLYSAVAIHSPLQCTHQMHVAMACFYTQMTLHIALQLIHIFIDDIWNSFNFTIKTLWQQDS